VAVALLGMVNRCDTFLSICLATSDRSVYIAMYLLASANTRKGFVCFTKDMCSFGDVKETVSNSPYKTGLLSLAGCAYHTVLLQCYEYECRPVDD
jgi:hypothetical protein